MADTVVQELVINTLTQAQFDAAKEAGTLSPYELYGTPDTSVRLPVLTPMWFDHVVNDMSWLRADTFSWQSGDVYVAAYNHLAEDAGNLYAWASGAAIYYTLTETPAVGDNVYSSNVNDDPSQIESVDNGTITFDDPRSGVQKVATRDATGDSNPFVLGIGLKTDTIDGTTITYYLADDGHKICLTDQEINIVALYEKTGAADYYILDTTNKQFKLPRKQKRTLIQAVKNTDGTWYNLYSDGWVEQGGGGKTNVSVTLPVAMTDSNYVVLVENHVRVNGGTGASDMTTTSFIPRWQQHSAIEWGANNFAVSWQVSGYATESAYASAGMRLEYYYVGNFEQSAIEQTAGITAETLNSKADADLGNIPTNIDYVVESQFPTAENNYTWYRKYKSGWVEQGGTMTFPVAGASATTKTITFPIEMADTRYTAQPTPIWSQPDKYYGWVLNSKTTTSMNYIGHNTTQVSNLSWFVSGMAVQ